MFLSRNKSSFLASGLCLLASVCFCRAAPVSAESPFLPAPGPASAADKAGPLQLSGIMIIASKTYVCLTEVSSKKSRWLAVGAKVDAIEVVSCAPDKNQAVVRVNGESLTLTLKKSDTMKSVQMATAAPASPATPSAAVENQPPEKADEIAAKLTPLVTREEKEREARMLVSDLLDISLRQRKAYEDARKKADEDAAKKK